MPSTPRGCGGLSPSYSPSTHFEPEMALKWTAKVCKMNGLRKRPRNFWKVYAQRVTYHEADKALPFVIPVKTTIDEPHFIKHVSSKLLPHAIRVAINTYIVKECVHNGNGSRPGAAAPLAKSLGYLTEDKTVIIQQKYCALTTRMGSLLDVM
jgi:hypothetical protein